MAEIGFNSQNLAEISQTFMEKRDKSIAVKEQIDGCIERMRANWTGDAANLVGRERDFAEIDKNLDIIINNITTIGKFLEEKNTDFSQVTYK